MKMKIVNIRFQNKAELVALKGKGGPIHMNKIAIGLRINEKRYVIGVWWPKMDTLKSLARLEMTRLKQRLQHAAFSVAMTIMPVMAVA